MALARISRAAISARADVLQQLKDDHKRVKKAYRQFEKLDLESNPEQCQAIVNQVLDELTVHAALEEELLYPAAHGAIADESLVDEAEVEHESVHTFVDQLRGMGPEDEKYAARFTVLCEYVMHHVKEEETEMFPQLETVRLDWEDMAARMNQRRAELTGEMSGDEEEGDGTAGARIRDSTGDAEEMGAEDESTETAAAGGPGPGPGSGPGPTARSKPQGRRARSTA